MKDKFIRFLKDNHAFDEFKEAIHKSLTYGFDELFDDFEEADEDDDFDIAWNVWRDTPECLLEDGVVFFYENYPSVDWLALYDEWVSLYPPIKQSCDNCIYFEGGKCTNILACELNPNLINRWEIRK